MRLSPATVSEAVVELFRSTVNNRFLAELFFTFIHQPLLFKSWIVLSAG